MARRANRGNLPAHLHPCEAWLRHDARRSSSSRRPRHVRAAAALCTSSARTSRNASTKFRPSSG
jgi:hypothetical protein